MYKGFNLDFDIKDDLNKVEEVFEVGNSVYRKRKNEVKVKLENFLLDNGSIDGSIMQENWFPQIKADIFISHSHKDQKNAIFLAGLIKKVFDLEVFIDSCIWGNSIKLQKIIDDKFCKSVSGNYDYSKRNYSTSHVHMMLSTALNKMIDKTECLFFLNTPNSTNTQKVIQRTESPWIYSEIAMSKLLQDNDLRKYRKDSIKKFSKGGTIDVYESIEYELDLAHLTNIDGNDIINWRNSYNDNNKIHPLDVLYRNQSLKNQLED